MPHPLLEMLRAQRENLLRIQPGFVLDGTDSNGEPLEILSTKAPDLIRLLDVPLRLQQAAVRAESPYERILTLAPAGTRDAGKIANRRDIIAKYIIHGAVWLTKDEQELDRQEDYEENPLSEKLMALASDVDMIFYDDMNLGLLVQDVVGYETVFVIDYPVGVFSTTVDCLIAGCRQ